MHTDNTLISRHNSIGQFSGSLTMSSVEIADLTGKEHKNVLADTRKMLSDLDISPADFSAVYKDQQLKDRPCFNLPKDLTLTLISGYSIQLRKKIIDRWLELEGAQFKMPQTFAEALRLAADTQEALDSAQKQIEADKPKVEFAMAVRNMQGACKVGEFAKVIGTGRNRLFEQMRQDGILMINNQPYQRYIDQGFFVVIEQIPYTDSKGKDHPAFTSMITGKGQVWLEKKYRGVFAKSKSEV